MDEVKALYDELVEKIKKYHPAKDFSMLEKAYKFALEAHKGQVRKSGEPYIVHPLKVAILLAELELDMESIIAGILHDIIEDTDYTYEDISEMFSPEIALIVDGVTKLGKISFSTKEEVQAENYRKMFIAMAKDIRVILIKLADRLHNMRTLGFMTPEKQKEKAQETLDIYAPLANRLGISKIKIELEDLCLKYLDNDGYKDLKEKIVIKKTEREEYVQSIVRDIKEKMTEAGIEGSVDGRTKHFFSIYKKMRNKGRTFDQIYDLFAVRVIVDSVKDCYAVLGIIHEMYKPMPGRFKDYIAMPKANMYQSLHNTMIGPKGEPFEIQIRTWEMHRTAEYGIAAHWKYKEGVSGEKNTNKEEQKLTWLRRILEWQTDMSDNKEFISVIKQDLNIFDDQVYCFTPKGDVITLPNGSTPIDFAYYIHTAIGNKMVGARVNGKIVTFDYKLQNGDRIDIITSQNSKGPSRDWLNLVKSSQARTKINNWFKKEFKEDNIIKGKELFERDAKKKGYNAHDLMKPEWVKIVIEKFGFKDWDALCAAIGHGGLKEGAVTNRFIEEVVKERKKNRTPEEIIKEIEEVSANRRESRKAKYKSGVRVKGIGDVNVRFSKCCNPVPGDEIVGFITRGRGVSIHRTDCVNIINLNEFDRHRLIDTEWDISDISAEEVIYSAELKIFALDRPGLTLDIAKVLSEGDMNVHSINCRSTKDAAAVCNVVIDINSKDQLEKISNKLRGIKGVSQIERVTG